jgi:DNA-binding FadR family transcriptional regulator
MQDENVLRKLQELDYQYHSRLIESSENIIFCTLFRTAKRVHDYYTGLFYQHSEVRQETWRQHRRLEDAIAEGNEVLAEMAAGRMLEYGQKQVCRYWES